MKLIKCDWSGWGGVVLPHELILWEYRKTVPKCMLPDLYGWRIDKTHEFGEPLYCPSVHPFCLIKGAPNKTD